MKDTDAVFEVEKLREAYQKSAEYLEEQKKYVNFEKGIKSKISNYAQKVKTENKVFELENKCKELKIKTDKQGTIDDAYEKYYKNKLSLPELENILRTKKEYIDVRNQLKEATKTAKKLVDDYKMQVLSQSKEEYEALKQSVIKKGMQTICFTPSKWLGCEEDAKYSDYEYDEDSQKNIEEFKKCILANKFYYSDYCDDINHIGSFQMIRQWFDSLDGDFPLCFDNKKIIKELPSPFEFYQSRINKYFSNDYEKVTIVTNDFSEDYWKYDDCTDIDDCGDHYYVYVTTLLAPKEIAQKLKETEKELTKKSIEKMTTKNKEIFVLKAENFEYGKTDFKPKFTEELREKIRQKFEQGDKQNGTKATCINYSEYFDYFEDYHYYGDTKFVTLPDPKTANAIFDTLEYVFKLRKISKLKKFNNQKNNYVKQLENDYDLEKTM